jgi:hypothetical protein
MNSVTVRLDPELERKLREKAAHSGQTLELYLERLAALDAYDGPRATDVDLSEEEFERLLDALSVATSVPHLPGDFCRTDVYQDHD